MSKVNESVAQPIPTGTQEEYMFFIDQYVRAYDNFPTCKELGQRFKVWPNAAKENLTLLKNKGFLEYVIGRNCFRRTDKFKEYMAIKARAAA